MIAIHGTLGDCFHQMLASAVRMTDEGRSIAEELPDVHPDTYDWDMVTDDTWFVCVGDDKCYYFPMMESENRERAYHRVKRGMRSFMGIGWRVKQLQ